MSRVIMIATLIITLGACTKHSTETVVPSTNVASVARGTETINTITQGWQGSHISTSTAGVTVQSIQQRNRHGIAVDNELIESSSNESDLVTAQGTEDAFTCSIDELIEMNGVHISRSGWASESTPMIVPSSPTATNWLLSFQKVCNLGGTYSVYITLASLPDRLFDFTASDSQAITNLQFNTSSVHFTATQQFYVGAVRVTASTNIFTLQGTTSLSPHIHSLEFRRHADE